MEVIHRGADGGIALLAAGGKPPRYSPRASASPAARVTDMLSVYDTMSYAERDSVWGESLVLAPVEAKGTALGPGAGLYCLLATVDEDGYEVAAERVSTGRCMSAGIAWGSLFAFGMHIPIRKCAGVHIVLKRFRPGLAPLDIGDAVLGIDELFHDHSDEVVDTWLPVASASDSSAVVGQVHVVGRTHIALAPVPCSVHVRIISAKGLPNRLKAGGCNAYVTVAPMARSGAEVRSSKTYTRTVPKSTAPVWEEDFVVGPPLEVSLLRSILFKVKHSKAVRHASIGEVHLVLSELWHQPKTITASNQFTVRQWYPIRARGGDADSTTAAAVGGVAATASPDVAAAEAAAEAHGDDDGEHDDDVRGRLQLELQLTFDDDLPEDDCSGNVVPPTAAASSAGDSGGGGGSAAAGAGGGGAGMPTKRAIAPSAAGSGVDDDNIVTGWLTKLGAKSSRWQRRWFVFRKDRGTLHYFKNDKPNQKAKGFMDLRSSQVLMEGPPKPKPATPHVIKVQNPTRDLYLCATDAASQRFWLGVLSSCMVMMSDDDVEQRRRSLKQAGHQRATKMGFGRVVARQSVTATMLSGTAAAAAAAVAPKRPAPTPSAAPSTALPSAAAQVAALAASAAAPSPVSGVAPSAPATPPAAASTSGSPGAVGADSSSSSVSTEPDAAAAPDTTAACDATVPVTEAEAAADAPADSPPEATATDGGVASSEAPVAATTEEATTPGDSGSATPLAEAAVVPDAAPSPAPAAATSGGGSGAPGTPCLDADALADIADLVAADFGDDDDHDEDEARDGPPSALPSATTTPTAAGDRSSPSAAAVKVNNVFERLAAERQAKEAAEKAAEAKRVAAMTPEEKLAYEAEKAAKVKHESRRRRMSRTQLTAYGGSSAREMLTTGGRGRGRRRAASHSSRATP